MKRRKAFFFYETLVVVQLNYTAKIPKKKYEQIVNNFKIPCNSQLDMLKYMYQSGPMIYPN